MTDAHARPWTLARRRLLAAGLSVTALTSAGPALAALIATPRQTLGPFYPRQIPLDSDADLTRVAGHDGMAEGEPVHVFGRVLDLSGRPLEGARIEIWQCDAFGHYHHPGDRGGPRDLGFQGYGRTVSGGDGGYRFRTIRPVPYPGRTPHIHFAVSAPGRTRLVTQMYLAGHPQNQRDGIFMGVRDPAARASLLVDFNAESAAALGVSDGAPAGRFDIVLG
jgi:protocatechuate 3,4-dioxygenase beta subunit